MMFFGCSLPSVSSLKCISVNNRECKVGTPIVILGINLCFFPFSIKISKCSGSCNNVNNPYAKLSVPDVVKNVNAKVFILMSRTNETRQI